MNFYKVDSKCNEQLFKSRGSVLGYEPALIVEGNTIEEVKNIIKLYCHQPDKEIEYFDTLHCEITNKLGPDTQTWHKKLDKLNYTNMGNILDKNSYLLQSIGYIKNNDGKINLEVPYDYFIKEFKSKYNSSVNIKMTGCEFNPYSSQKNKKIQRGFTTLSLHYKFNCKSLPEYFYVRSLNNPERGVLYKDKAVYYGDINEPLEYIYNIDRNKTLK